MYLKRVNGRRTVTLPDGTVMTRADLPPRDTRRWVASRKAAVVRAVTHGLISREDAEARYALSREEFAEWQEAVQAHGDDGLKVTLSRKGKQL